MDNFFNYECHKCGGIDEAKFSIAGPHVKQTCLHCGAYVKFFDKGRLPSLIEIRLKIWQITKEDIATINKAKESVGYKELPVDKSLYNNTWPKSVLEILQWWKVYLKVRSLVPSSE